MLHLIHSLVQVVSIVKEMETYNPLATALLDSTVQVQLRRGMTLYTAVNANRDIIVLKVSLLFKRFIHSHDVQNIPAWTLFLQVNLIYVFFLPSGSYEPQPCPGGMFCQFAGLSEPTDNCSAGHYCSVRASSPTPVDGVTGDICPPGFYCPAGLYFFVESKSADS